MQKFRGDFLGVVSPNKIRARLTNERFTIHDITLKIVGLKIIKKGSDEYKAEFRTLTSLFDQGANRDLLVSLSGDSINLKRHEADAVITIDRIPSKTLNRMLLESRSRTK